MSQQQPVASTLIANVFNVLFVVQAAWSALTTSSVVLAFLGWLVVLVCVLAAVILVTAGRMAKP